MKSHAKIGRLNFFKNFIFMISHALFSRTSFNLSFLAIQFLGLTSCSHPNGEFAPTVMLTFDDNHVSDWLLADSMFKKYDAKATFFVTHLDKMDSIDYAGLHMLYRRGHEIGCHGFRHADPVEYIDSAGIASYLKHEVDAAVLFLNNKGFEVKSFAFPFGNYSPALCDSIEARGLYMRGAIYNKTDIFHRSPRPLNQLNVFITRRDQLFASAMGIDFIYNNTIDLIAPGLERCVRDSVAMVLYAHRVLTDGSDYSAHPAFIDSILSLGSKLNIRFTTFSDR